MRQWESDMVYDISAKTLDEIFDIPSRSLSIGYGIGGNIIFQKRDDVLLSYDVFYPDDAESTYETTSFTNVTISADEFLSEFYDGYVQNPPTGITVTKTSLGKDSTGTYDIYEYDFNPITAKRKIMLVSGEHAYESTAQFGLAHLIKHIYTDLGNSAFEYIRKYVRVKVVPIMNPWGVNQSPRAYGVYRQSMDSSYYFTRDGKSVCGGINPERNFTYNGLWEMFSSSHDGGTAGDPWNKKGDYPFQTAETRIYARWCMNNQDADFIINCHTGEDSTQQDIWIDYMSDSVLLPAILEAVRKNEEKFREKFNREPNTELTGTAYPNSTGYGMHGAWNMFCIRFTGITMEQAPKNTVIGNGKNNGAGAINNYASVTATYIMEFLLNKYQYIYDDLLHPNNKVPIRLVSSRDIEIKSNEYTATISLLVTPNNTTQFTFDWVSSDTSVCEVWGCTEQAVLVKRGTGTAVITATNRINQSITTYFTVTCN